MIHVKQHRSRHVRVTTQLEAQLGCDHGLHQQAFESLVGPGCQRCYTEKATKARHRQEAR